MEDVWGDGQGGFEEGGVDLGCWKTRCVTDVEIIVREWPTSMLHGAQKGLDAREVDEHVFSSGDIDLS